ncbi:NlpC/P60 family protein [Seleniivibrio woodruffii]|uniref:NlpC/P60 family protein n=1 Tax=Seleniivibrio woodruffii TaxID=1078050 RepID=UPI0026EF756A|nr:NlpC/P60 family protein [Seleniivibrio woodruffii]
MKMKYALLILFVLITASGCFSGKQTVLVPTPDNGFTIAPEQKKFIDYYLRELDSSEKTALIETVKTAAGTKYVWGGNEPEGGIDCSGLLVWAYSRLGYTGFRNDEDVVDDITSNDMYVYDTAAPSPITDMKQFLDYETGDFLFLDVNHDGRIDHVAVFMHYDTETETVWVWDASTNTRMVAYRPVTGILSKKPYMGRPMVLEPKQSPLASTSE